MLGLFHVAHVPTMRASPQRAAQRVGEVAALRPPASRVTKNSRTGVRAIVVRLWRASVATARRLLEDLARRLDNRYRVRRPATASGSAPTARGRSSSALSVYSLIHPSVPVGADLRCQMMGGDCLYPKNRSSSVGQVNDEDAPKVLALCCRQGGTVFQVNLDRKCTLVASEEVLCGVTDLVANGEDRYRFRIGWFVVCRPRIDRPVVGQAVSLPPIAYVDCTDEKIKDRTPVIPVALHSFEIVMQFVDQVLGAITKETPLAYRQILPAFRPTLFHGR
jgi:hypothetical protein